MNKPKGLKCQVRIRRFHSVSGRFVLLVIIFLIFLIITLRSQFSEVGFYSKDGSYHLARAPFAKNYAVQTKRDNISADSYIVQNPSCSIPDINPYEHSTENYFFEWGSASCSELEPLTSVVYYPSSQTHTLKINSQTISSYSSIFSRLVCCYSVITREYYAEMRGNDDDNRYLMGNEICFENEKQLPVGTEYIYVTCSSNKAIVYHTVHLMVTNKKTNLTSPAHTGDRKKISIFLLGIDSMSRLNFVRNFPKTKKYIEARGWLPLEGYTKIADNTFPNVIAVLTGMSVKQLTKACIRTWNDQFDDCPFIWQHFSKNGYLTSFSEDAVEIGTFNIAKYGFLNSPTDYYTRPIMEVAFRKLPQSHKYSDTPYCMGGRPQVEYLLDFNTEFLKRFHDRPYFNLFWSSSFSHNELNIPSTMDDRYKSFLQDIDDYLNSTVVVFFSDHGLRVGKYRESYRGWHEERMPFMYIYLPPSLRATHPQWYHSLQANRNKLVSTFDLYATLQQLLNGQVQPPACPKCVSLLSPVPHNRSCTDAGIKPRWCPCLIPYKFKSVSNIPSVQKMARSATDSINGFLQNSSSHLENGYHCSKLNFSRILRARRLLTGDATGNYKETYVIVFETKPNEAIFEITRRRLAKNAIRVEEISRISRYGNQSACVRNDAQLKLFCFCVKEVDAHAVTPISKIVEQQKPISRKL